MAAPRYSVLGLALLALLLVTACSGSIFGKDESKVGATPCPFRHQQTFVQLCSTREQHTQRQRFGRMRVGARELQG